jgi:hypothetical protein
VLDRLSAQGLGLLAQPSGRFKLVGLLRPTRQRERVVITHSARAAADGELGDKV